MFDISEDLVSPKSLAEPLVALRLINLQWGTLETNLDNPVFSGFSNIDETICGLRRGAVTVIGSQHGIGGTDLALNFVSYVALTQEFPVLIFSLNKTELEITGRLVSQLSGKNRDIPGNGQARKSSQSSVDATMAKLETAPIFVVDTPALSAEQICAQTRRMVNGHGRFGLIVIDGIESIHPYWAEPRGAANYESTMTTLRSLAKTFQVSVLILTNLTVELKQRQDMRPRVTDLIDASVYSGADRVWLMYRNGYYDRKSKESDVTEIIVAKGAGLHDEPFLLSYDKASGSFRECGQEANVGNTRYITKEEPQQKWTAGKRKNGLAKVNS